MIGAGTSSLSRSCVAAADVQLCGGSCVHPRNWFRISSRLHPRNWFGVGVGVHPRNLLVLVSCHGVLLCLTVCYLVDVCSCLFHDLL